MKTAFLLFVAAATTMFFLNFDQTKRERLVLSTPSGYTTPKPIARETIENRLAQVDAVAEASAEQVMEKVAQAEKPAAAPTTKAAVASKKKSKASKARIAKNAPRGKAKKATRRTQIARR